MKKYSIELTFVNQVKEFNIWPFLEEYNVEFMEMRDEIDHETKKIIENRKIIKIKGTKNNITQFANNIKYLVEKEKETQ